MPRFPVALLFVFLAPYGAQAALPAVQIPPPRIQLDVKEILSLPAENRLLVASSRVAELKPQLEKYAFDKQKDYSDRWKAVVLYAQISGKESHVFLSKALRSPEWFMRNAALAAYHEVSPSRGVSAAKLLLADEALVVRSAAIGFLEKHLDSEIREMLWNELDQPRNFRKKQSLWTRPQIVEALATAPVISELPLFVAALRDSDGRMNTAAMTALERLTSHQLDKGIKGLEAKRQAWLKWMKNNPNTRDL